MDNSVNLALGIQANELTTGYLDGATGYTVNVYSGNVEAYGLQVAEFTEDFDWTVIANGKKNVYGIQSDTITFDKNFSGDLAVTSREGRAHGLHGAVLIKEDFDGSVSSIGLYETFGIYGSLTVNGNYNGSILSHSTATWNSPLAYGIAGNVIIFHTSECVTSNSRLGENVEFLAPTQRLSLRCVQGFAFKQVSLCDANAGYLGLRNGMPCRCAHYTVRCASPIFIRV